MLREHRNLVNDAIAVQSSRIYGESIARVIEADLAGPAAMKRHDFTASDAADLNDTLVEFQGKPATVVRDTHGFFNYVIVEDPMVRGNVAFQLTRQHNAAI